MVLLPILNQEIHLHRKPDLPSQGDSPKMILTYLCCLALVTENPEMTSTLIGFCSEKVIYADQQMATCDICPQENDYSRDFGYNDEHGDAQDYEIGFDFFCLCIWVAFFL